VKVLHYHTYGCGQSPMKLYYHFRYWWYYSWWVSIHWIQLAVPYILHFVNGPVVQ